MPVLKNIIGIGESNFKELIENGYLYIDKTAYLKDLVSSGTKVLFMLRPRRFGKTLTMSMIHYFLEMNYRNPDDYSLVQNLFKDLAISKETEPCKKHMGEISCYKHFF